MRGLLAFTSDTATHKTAPVLLFNKEFPEFALSITRKLGFKVVARESLRFLVTDTHFNGLHTGQLLKTFINIARDEVLVAAMKLGIGFLNEWHPYFVQFLALTKNRFSSVDVTRDAFVD